MIDNQQTLRIMTDRKIFVETSVDYGTNTVLVVFDEDYTEEEVSQRVSEIHPNMIGECTYFEQPSNSRSGYRNSGTARFEYSS